MRPPRSPRQVRRQYLNHARRIKDSQTSATLEEVSERGCREEGSSEENGREEGGREEVTGEEGRFGQKGSGEEEGSSEEGSRQEETAGEAAEKDGQSISALTGLQTTAAQPEGDIVPHSTWPERLKWAEEQGLKNLQEKFTTGDNMNKEAQTTLTYILTGMGGTLAFLIQGLERQLSAFLFGTIILCGWFTLLGIILVVRTLVIGEFPSPFQEPKNLLGDPEDDLDEVRLVEVGNIDERIEEAAKWNERKGKTINRIRAALLGSPFIFVLAIFVYKHCGLG